MRPITTLGEARKDGKCTVYLIVHVQREKIRVNTKILTEPLLMDLDKGQIRGKTKKIKDDNLIIEKCRSRINDILVKYRLRNKEITAKEFKFEYSNPSSDIDFLVWMQEEIRLLKNQVGARRIIKYTTILNKLREFRDPISFSEIDRFFIEDFRGWCKTKKKNDISTISTNLNVIKVFTNRAMRKDLLTSDPFLDIRIGRSKPDRTFCSEEEFKILWNMYKGDPERRLNVYLIPVLRHFLFMCFTGLRISDFTDVSFDNIVNTTLRLYPIKTRSKKKEMVKIPLCPEALRLIKDEGNTTGKLFHPITEQRMNLNIKNIAKIAGIKKPLTNHSARHTFATLFIKKTSDVATLQKLLGHSRIEETMVYVHITEENLITQMSKFIQELDIDNKKQKIPSEISEGDLG